MYDVDGEAVIEGELCAEARIAAPARAITCATLMALSDGVQRGGKSVGTAVYYPETRCPKTNKGKLTTVN